MTALGLDLSLTSTGVAFSPTDTIVIRPSDAFGLGRRLDTIDFTLRSALALRPCPALAVVEAPFMGILSPGTTIKLGMVHGVVRACLDRHGIPLATIQPAALKTWATGHGKASKAEMVKAANALGFPCKGAKWSDEADALWCWTVAEALSGRWVVERTEQRLALLGQVDQSDAMAGAS
jgi:Holliday junction resolvasome RuvABC endonuclease subunit